MLNWAVGWELGVADACRDLLRDNDLLKLKYDLLDAEKHVVELNVNLFAAEYALDLIRESKRRILAAFFGAVGIGALGWGLWLYRKSST
jgi:hypothetical protein